MHINQTRLLGLIREALEPGSQEHLNPDDEEKGEEYNSPVYQMSDTLVTALQDVIVRHFENAGKIGNGPGQMTKNDIELEYEEALMDALLPIAEKLIGRGENMGYGDDWWEERDDEDEDDSGYAKLPRPTEDPMGRGAQTSDLRRTVMRPRRDPVDWD